MAKKNIARIQRPTNVIMLTGSADPEAFVAEVITALTLTKKGLDVGKDVYQSAQKLRPSHPLRFDILDSRGYEKMHRIRVRVTNQTDQGIYLEKLWIPTDNTDPRSILQAGTIVPTLRPTGSNISLGDSRPSESITLPLLLPPHEGENTSALTFDMAFPLLDEKKLGEESHAIAELSYSKLDEAKSGTAKFRFRVRWS